MAKKKTGQEKEKKSPEPKGKKTPATKGKKGKKGTEKVEVEAEEVSAGAEGKVVSEPDFLKSVKKKASDINPLTLEPRQVGPDEEIQLTTPLSEFAPIMAPVSGKAATLADQLGLFFGELKDSYADRYSMWEDSINAVLLIMRKMQGTTAENSKQLVSAIEDFNARIKLGLGKFEKKRNAVEAYSGVDLRGTLRQLKEVMTLLKLQVQEYDLKTRVDTYMRYMS